MNLEKIEKSLEQLVDQGKKTLELNEIWTKILKFLVGLITLVILTAILTEVRGVNI